MEGKPESTSNHANLAREEVSRGLWLISDTYDCSTELIVAANGLRRICDAEYDRAYAASRGVLHWDDAVTDGHVEFMALLFLRQIAALTRAAVIVNRDRRAYAGTASPVTLFERTIFEGIVYTDYLLSDDPGERYFDVVIGDAMHDNSVLEQIETGQKYSRRRANDGVTKGDGALTWGLRDKEWSVKGDVQEAAWLRRRIRSFSSQVASVDLDSLDLAGLRDKWAELGRATVAGQREHERWLQLKSQWNRLHQWLFGVSPVRALERGTLIQRISARPDAPPGVDSSVKFLSWLGLDSAHPFAHFSPKRVGPLPAVDRRRVLAGLFKIAWMLSLLAPSFPDRYTWAAAVKEVAEDLSAKLVRQAVAAVRPDLVSALPEASAELLSADGLRPWPAGSRASTEKDER